MSRQFPALILLLGLLLPPALRAQYAPMHELNRVFTLTPTHLVALELDGSIAWMTPLGIPVLPGAPPRGLLVDPRGYIWFTNTWTQSLYRYRTDGSFDLSIPLPSTGAISGMYMYPALGRSGDLYIPLREHILGFGIVNKLIKINATISAPPSVAWILDLSPQIALSSPPYGILHSLQVDEDGNIWVPISSENLGGGRLVKLDPTGAILLSFQATCGSFQLNTDRSVWIALDHGPAGRLPFTGLPPTPASGGYFAWPTSLGSMAHSHISNDWFDETGDGLYRFRNSLNSPPPALGAVEPIGVLGPSNQWNYNLTSPSGAPQVAGYTVGGGFDPLGRLWSIGMQQAGPHLLQYFAARIEPQSPWDVAHHTWISLPFSDGAGTPRSSMGVSLYRHCLMVDPWSDFDQDGVANRNEIASGTNPLDPSSTPGTIDRNTLELGATTSLTLSSPADATLPYISLLSPNLPWTLLADGRGIGPDPALDPFAAYWLSPGAGFATGITGVLDSAGNAPLSITLPNVPALDGLTVNLSYVTLDLNWSLGMKTLFGPAPLTLCTPGGSCP